MKRSAIGMALAAAIVVAAPPALAQVTVNKSGGVSLEGVGPTTISFVLDERDAGEGRHPIYRIGAESSLFVTGSGGSAGGRSQVTSYLCDAPAEITLGPGTYRFTTSDNVMTGVKFDVRADGGSQTWRIHYGKPVLGYMSAYMGWMAVLLGGMTSVACMLYGDSDSEDITESRHAAIAGGAIAAAAGAGLIFFTVPLRPSAKRVD